ncbi:hypothetical protein ACF052_32480 [Streptomyces pilosus]|uniref:hypothetical protein n=1 Tax=Streptomyces pilosus TaxID=28893 RepID=UPI0036FAF74B
MFLNGFDEARSGGLLRGFNEWLVVRKGELCSFGWPALIIEESLPAFEGWSNLGLTSYQEREAI